MLYESGCVVYNSPMFAQAQAEYNADLRRSRRRVERIMKIVTMFRELEVGVDHTYDDSVIRKKLLRLVRSIEKHP
jgi:hypothetical protein